MKGVLVQFTAGFAGAVPNVIAFQFNPESLRRTWTQPVPQGGANPLGVQGPPGEEYALTLMLDSDDVQARDLVGPAVADAKINGLHSRIASLEMLMYPVLTGKTGKGRSVPAALVPLVVFVWGPARILPVRVTALSITETLFDDFLRPTRATVELGFRVMTEKEIDRLAEPLKGVAKGACTTARIERETGALVNLGTTFDFPAVLR